MKRTLTLITLLLLVIAIPFLIAATTHYPGGGATGTDSYAIHDQTSGEINAVAEKESPVGNDLLIIEDSADTNKKKKVKIGNLPAATGDVTGPATNTDAYIPQWDGADAKKLKNGVELSTDTTMAGNSDTAVPTEKASKTYVDGKIHVQGTDTGLDTGGTHPVTAEEAESAYDAMHTQGTDQYLDEGGENEVAAYDAKDAVDKKHAQNTDTGTTASSWLIDSDNTGARVKYYSGALQARNAADDDYVDFYAKTFRTAPSSTQAGFYKMKELSGNGENFLAWQAPDAITANVTHIYPNTLPSANSWYGWGVPSVGVSTGVVMKFGNLFTVTAGEVTHNAATDAAKGIVELATPAETTTGQDDTRAATPDGIRGSTYGINPISINAVPIGTAVEAKTYEMFWGCPAIYNGWKIINISAFVDTKGVTGTTNVDIIKTTGASTSVDVCSTPITLGDEEYISDETINTSNNTLATGDRLTVKVEAIHSGTAPDGLTICIEIQKPEA